MVHCLLMARRSNHSKSRTKHGCSQTLCFQSVPPLELLLPTSTLQKTPSPHCFSPDPFTIHLLDLASPGVAKAACSWPGTAWRDLAWCPIWQISPSECLPVRRNTGVWWRSCFPSMGKLVQGAGFPPRKRSSKSPQCFALGAGS